MDTRRFKRERPTIGILAGRSILGGKMPDYYRIAVIRGIQSAAQSQNCNLLISWEIRPNSKTNQFYAAWPAAAPESDFIPVGPWNTDALIVFAPLTNIEQSHYIQQLIKDGFPVLFIATGEDGPAISVDNQIGIYQAVEHLVQHGHQRIAFLAGIPTDNGDSKARLEAYRSAVEKYNLESNPELVAWGWHDSSQGYTAMQGFLENGVKFTAMVASNDNSAIGAIQAIREAGLNIPRDIAIIGFDDQPGVIAQVPPLTSVHVPLTRIGEQAVLEVIEHLTSQLPLESIHIPTRLVQRQSCGCIPDVVSSAVIGPTFEKKLPSGRPARPTLKAAQKELASEMLSTIPSELRFPAGEQIQRTCAILVESFYTSLKLKKYEYFETAFIRAIQELETADANLEHWQEMLSALRREMIRLPLAWKLSKTRQLAENMIHQARAILTESVQRQDYRHRYMRDMEVRALNSVTAQLSAALSDVEVIELLNTYLPKIGIRHMRLMFFEAELEDPYAWSVTAGLDNESPAKRFRSREFPPPNLYTQDEVLNVILLPLVFQSEVLGYAAFEASDMESCAAIARQLSATIKVSQLHTQIVELSLTDPLTGLYNRRYLDLFLASEIARGQRFLAHEFSIIMVDIDHFKSYNDQFGHPAGDEALRQVAGCLTDGRRATDVVTRIGGEEFALILPETDIEGAVKCAEKLRTSVAALTSLDRPITISLGVTVFNGDIYEPEALLQQADQALYEAKGTGRNRICIYQEKISGK